MEDRHVPLRDENGRLVATEGVARDITERKQAQEALQAYSERLEEMVEQRTQELRETQEELVRKERLAVLGQLAGGVAHELRNPLGVIKNAAYFLNMALSEGPEPEVEEAIEILEKEVANSERIIGSLLDVARPRPPFWRNVAIADVIQEALSRTATSDLQHVEVVRQLDEPLPVVQADPDQLVQVFANLILNGIQAMPDGGRLVITSRVESPEWVVISVADTGVGIAEENRSRLFEPLFTTKAKGIGLGLALAKILVEGHGGSIEVESKERKGSTFTVKLPLGTERVQSQVQEEQVV
jgi:signal transduction histidine kinase